MNDPTQPVPPYIATARRARSSLNMAIGEAEEMLPPAVTKMHWQAKQHATAPWASVEAHYCTREDSDPAISRVLCDLKLMAEALVGLACVLTKRSTTGSLKLAKTRHVEPR